MKSLLLWLLLPYLVLFCAGYLCALLTPPLCWWLDRRARQGTSPTTTGGKRGVSLPTTGVPMYASRDELMAALARATKGRAH